MSKKISRRSFLKISGALVVAGALAACGGSGGGSSSGGSYNPGSSSGGIQLSYNIDGLKMWHPVVFGTGRLVTSAGSYNIPYIDFYFRSETGAPIVIAPSSFESCKFDGSSTRVRCFDSLNSPLYRFTINGSQSQRVRVYFDVQIPTPKPTDLDALTKAHKFSFNIAHGHQKAVCTGTYRFLGLSNTSVSVVYY